MKYDYKQKGKTDQENRPRDPRDDQRSIKLGYYYGNIRNYKNKFYKVIVGSITKEVLR